MMMMILPERPDCQDWPWSILWLLLMLLWSVDGCWAQQVPSNRQLLIVVWIMQRPAVTLADSDIFWKS